MLAVCFKVDSQNQQPGYLAYPNVFLPSPTAQGLGKYGDVPVNLSNGIPQIKVPVYELKDGDITIPVELNYMGSAIKVASIASWVGTSWSLNAGGVITRAVKGLPDEGVKGLFQTFAGNPLTLLPNPFVNTFDQNILTDEQNRSYIRIVADNWDTEPDMFYYNFLGYTGKFFFDHHQNIHLVPHDDIKIEAIGPSLDQFKVTTPRDGFIYIFGTSAATEKTMNSIDSNPFGDDVYRCNTAWYLKSITLPSGQTVSFNYSDGHILTSSIAEESDYKSLWGIPAGNCQGHERLSRYISNLIQTTDTKRLSSIESDNAIIYFDAATAAREDLPGDYALSRIRVFSKKLNAVIKQFSLNYSYYNSPISYCALRTSHVAEAKEQKRLILNSVKEELPGQTTVTSKVYSFEYDNGDLPPTCSCSIDYYGYYNGASNVTLLPAVSNMNADQPVANRESNSSYINNHLLKKIIYPTGGYSLFSFNASTATRTIDVPTLSSAGVRRSSGEAFGTTSTNFSIPFSQTINLSYTSYTGNNLDAEIAGIIRIKNASNQVVYERSFMENRNSSGIDPVYFSQPGNFTLQVTTQYVTGTDLEAGFSYQSGVAQQQTQTYSAGSSFIKEIGDYSADNKLLKRKIYTYENINIQWIAHDEDYKQPFRDRTFYYVFDESGAIIDVKDFACDFQRRTSNAFYNLGGLEGERISYGKVTVSDDPLFANGKTVYQFRTDDDDNYNILRYPYPPGVSYGWRRGLLENKTDFDKDGNKKYEIINTYSFSQKYDALYFKLGIKDFYSVRKYDPKPVNPNLLSYEPFHIISEWIKLAGRTEIFYDKNPLKWVKNVERYFYESPDNVQVSRTEKDLSDGKTLLEYSTFITDYSTGTLWINDLRTQNFKAVPIEKVSAVKSQQGNISIVSGLITSYKAGGKGLKDVEYSYSYAKSVPLEQFKFSNQPAGVLPQAAVPGNFAKDESKYEPRFTYTWGNTGTPVKIKLLQYQKTDAEKTSVYWGYNATLPTVEAKNAGLSEFYCEGFEESAATNVVTGVAHTGTRYYNGASYTVSWTRPNARKFLISYWYRSGAVWKLKPEQDYTGSAFVLTGGDAYDDIRIYPSDALLKTYTYLPIVGITSETDTRGSSIYYEYDGFYRLKFIRDQDGKILKQFDYQYQKLPTN